MMQANIISAKQILSSEDLFRAADAHLEQEENITTKHIRISAESWQSSLCLPVVLFNRIALKTPLKTH